MISYLKTVTTVPHLTSLPTLLKLNTTARIWKRMVASKKFVLAKHFDGPPKESDLQLVEEELPPIKDGEFLAKAIYLSVDPYMRAYAYKLPQGSTMVGTQVAEIVESKNRDFPVGKYVVGKFDWRDYTVSNGGTTEYKGPVSIPPTLLPHLGEIPVSLALGVLGLPGITAYFGFLEICKPKSGETVVISGASGAVGSHVGQIAKIKGCRVIGITGSDEKGQYIVKNFGFDAYVNYKTNDVDEQLGKVAPEGVDCYFDNVAGEISTTVIKHMNSGGRISVCGSISSYNYDPNNPPKVSVVQPYFMNNQLVMEGFQCYLFYDRQDEAFKQNLQWIQEGKLKYNETITNGFENMPKAFIEMLQGKNIGKAIVKV